MENTNSKEKVLTYAGSGVNYENLDAFKRAATDAASLTAGNLTDHGFDEVRSSRGESCYVIYKEGVGYFGHVEEGLGTKNIIADIVGFERDNSFYHSIAQDTVAMIVNDMITLGIRPVSVAMHLAVSKDDWFLGPKPPALIAGWKHACDLAGAAWAGGETPTLKDIIVPGTALLSGSALGFSQTIIRPNIQAGDSIILLQSSGIHANGLTLARQIANTLNSGYDTLLADGTTYGGALLTPTHIYVRAITDLLNRDIPISYMVNITGHGLRKLMRAQAEFTYVIETLPEQPPIFEFIQQNGPVEEREMYANYNMGAGFALFLPPESLKVVLSAINEENDYGFKAINAGYVTSGPKKVVIAPKGIVFEAETLQVRS